MKRILFGLLISIIALGNISCKAQDNIGWVDNQFTSIKYGYLYNWWAATNPAIIKYGYLYNGISVLDSRNIANEGWHIPSSTELQTLSTYLGGSSVAGGKLKETGITKWTSPNTGATNEVGFNAVPSGRRIGTTGLFSDINTFCKLGTTTFLTPQIAMTLSYNNAAFLTSTGSTIDKDGYSLRLTKDLTTLTHGQTGIYIGNDGKVYQTICIGTQEWLSENLMETKYRNGDAIPEVTDNTAWAALSTGARCSYNNVEANAGTTKKISSSDSFIVPSLTDFNILNSNFTIWSDEESEYIDFNSGAAIREMGLVHWDSPNTGATNEVGFNGRGSGCRFFEEITDFGKLKKALYLWTNTPSGDSMAWFNGVFYDDIYSQQSAANKTAGFSIRLCNPNTENPDGYVGSYTQNDGTIIPTIVINGVEWTMNLKETKWSDGTDIQNITDNTDWAALTTGARCVYNNDESNM